MHRERTPLMCAQLDRRIRARSARIPVRENAMTIPQSYVSAPTSRIHSIRVATLMFIALTAGGILSGCGNGSATNPEKVQPTATIQSASDTASAALVTEGQQAFRFDTFGDEQLWTGKLGLNDVIEKKVDPMTALKIGLKVDADVLPPGILEKVDLKSPATTVALLKMNAVVGLQATVDANNHITRLGVTCALCHSTVDLSLIHISEPTRQAEISYAVFCLKKKKK